MNSCYCGEKLKKGQKFCSVYCYKMYRKLHHKQEPIYTQRSIINMSADKLAKDFFKVYDNYIPTIMGRKFE